MGTPELVAEWVKFAKTDLDVAKQLFENMNPRPLEITCYHTQQSAEKVLKAFLVKSDILPPKTHDLNRLCKMCGDIDETFNEIADNCTDLNNYSNTPRYPFEIEILEDDAKIAIEKASEILEWVTEKLNKEL
jgi:HEPN domain-containing protein